MVKNTHGGKKAKGMARKNLNSSSGPKTVRLSNDPSEVYSQVSKYHGNGMCEVICADGDGVSRLCHIRGKFRGRGKRDNTVKTGTWVLIGLRDWMTSASESTSASKCKLDSCDLLEVYCEQDKKILSDRCPTVNWSIFIANDNRNNNISSLVRDDDFVFSNNCDEIIVGGAPNANVAKISVQRECPDISAISAINDINDINVDDI